MLPEKCFFLVKTRGVNFNQVHMYLPYVIKLESELSILKDRLVNGVISEILTIYLLSFRKYKKLSNQRDLAAVWMNENRSSKQFGSIISQNSSLILVFLIFTKNPWISIRTYVFCYFIMPKFIIVTSVIFPSRFWNQGKYFSRFFSSKHKG